MATTNFRQRMLNRLSYYLTSTVKKNEHISRLFNFIMDKPLYRGVFILGSGTAVAQLIGLLTAPVITRLYTPSDMGVLAIYSSVLSIVGIGATLRYEFAYALPKNDEDAINLFGLGFMLLFITTTGFALILLLIKDLMIEILGLSSIEQYVWFLLIGFFGMGFYNVLNYWAIRQRDYGRITYTKINQGFSGSACKIFLGVLSFGPMGLILGQIVSQIAGVTTLARAIWGKENKKIKEISLNRMIRMAKTYKSFPLFNLPASIVNTLSLQLPSIALLTLYNSDIVGFYALASMLVVLPGSLMSGSMGQAYLGEASKVVRESPQELRPLYVSTLKNLSIIGIPLIGLPAVCAPFVVPFIFGEAWAEAGWYCWPLAMMAIANFIASGISSFLLCGYNHWSLAWNITRFIGIVSVFYLSYLFAFSVIMTILAYAIIMVGTYVLNVIMNLRAISNFSMMALVTAC